MANAVRRFLPPFWLTECFVNIMSGHFDVSLHTQSGAEARRKNVRRGENR